VFELPNTLLHSLSGPLALANGTFQSNVPNGVGAVAFLFQELNLISSLSDRNLFVIKNGDGTSLAALDGTGQWIVAGQTASQAAQGFTIAGSLILSAPATTNLQYKSFIASAATAIAHRLDTNGAYATAGSKLLSIQNNAVEKYFYDFNGKPNAPTGGAADVVGTLTLNGATAVTVNTTAVAAASKIIMSRHTISGATPGNFSVTNITAGTSFAVTGVAGDTSTVDWMLIN